MKLTKNDEELVLHVKYKSRGDYKRLALQKRMRLAIKALERGGWIQTEFNEDKLTVNIKCYDFKIYHQVLKGFDSVAHLR